MKTWLLSLLCMSVLLLVVSCGGGGGSSTGPVTPPASTMTGRFVDAPVEGLEYAVKAVGQTAFGSTSLTAADGSFQYPEGATVRFLIGDVVLGESKGKGIITPVDLVRSISGYEAASWNDPTVLNIVRILMAANSGPDTTRIIIGPNTRQLLKGKQFSMTNPDAVTQLIALLAPPAPPTVQQAETHFQETVTTIYRLYAGAYEGTYEGTAAHGSVSGTWSLEVAESNQVSGIMQYQPAGGTVMSFPLSGAVDVTGSLLIGQNTVISSCLGIIDWLSGKVEATCKDASPQSSIRFSGVRK